MSSLTLKYKYKIIKIKNGEEFIDLFFFSFFYYDP